MAHAIQHVAVNGAGLAGWMCAAHLQIYLPEDVRITVVGQAQPDTDALYGQLLPPEAFRFHLDLGLLEPDLMRDTSTAFAFGGSVEDWGAAKRSWIQPFHLPLAPVAGVSAATLVAQEPSLSLQSLLISAEAARRGRFAHPPEDSDHPLSRAEYGYLFDPLELISVYRHLATRSERMDDLPRDVDLTIDTLPPQSASAPYAARLTRTCVDAPGLPLRRLVSNPSGWASEVLTRTTRLQLDVGTEGDIPFAPHASTKPWTDARVRIGHAARMIEPLTVAPLRLLLRDLRRLKDYFPASTDVEVEARVYSEATADDTLHAQLFHAAHFARVTHPASPYYSTHAADPHPKLVRKLDQYAARAYFTRYDHEPFETLDWAVLFDGLGLTPRRPDTLANASDPATVQQVLVQLREGIEAVVSKMPPHPLYLSKFLDYLARKQDSGPDKGNVRGRHVG